MKSADYYMSETPVARERRLHQQKVDRTNFTRDTMELVYSEDLDEIYAELKRLHAVVGQERTSELIDRLFGDRLEASMR